MGKSKKIRPGDEKMLREFQKRRRIFRYIVIATATLFGVGFVTIGLKDPEKIWIGWILLGLYAAAFFALRYVSRCPYCGTPIMKKFDQQTHCPYCHRAIRPSGSR